MAAPSIANSQSTGNLLATDLTDYGRLGIPPEVLAEAQIRRVTDSEARREYGFTKNDAHIKLDGILFPVLDPFDGHRTTCILRRDYPDLVDGKPNNKYYTPWGDGRHLYVVPMAAPLLKDTNVPIILVESPKSALALWAWSRRAGMDLIPIATGGCWGWRSQRAGSRITANGERVDVPGPMADVTTYCNGHPVYILFDTNVATNPDVQNARSALVAELGKKKRTCKVLICDLPLTDGVNGPDDYVGKCGDEAMKAIFAAAHPPSRAVEMPATSRPAGNGATDFEAVQQHSDDALALLFSERHEDLRYTAKREQWSVWDGKVWREDSTLATFDRVRKVNREISGACSEKRQAGRLFRQTVAAVERLARSDRRHAATIDQWDSDPWLLNTPGGVVDLRTGELRPARRDDYMSKITGAMPEGDCSRWLAFLQRITKGDQELQAYFQRVAGYCLTGSIKEHALFFFYGTGGNGKGTFVETMAAIMGDYAKTSPIEAFIDSQNEQHSTVLARLKGARLVTAVETEEGRRWAEAKLKAITGGDRITARFMRQDFFQYYPEFKLIISGNHKPGLRSVNESIRRRLHLTPFSVTITDAERDLDLKEKLQLEWPGILAWAVQGCRAWQAQRLCAPQAVTQATNDYLTQEDVISQWIQERCEMKAAKTWEFTDKLWIDWLRWSEDNREFTGSSKLFSQRLIDKGFVPGKFQEKRIFRGLTLRQLDQC